MTVEDNYYQHGSTAETGVDTPAHLINAYLLSKGLSKDELAKYGVRNTDKPWAEINGNPQLFNSILSSIGQDAGSLKSSLQGNKTTPGSGVTAEMRANDPQAAAAQYAKVDPQTTGQTYTPPEGAAVDQRYFVQPGETQDAYTKRVQGYYSTSQPQPGYNGTITSDMLQSGSAPKYGTTPSPTGSSYNSIYAATPQESKISGETNKALSAEQQMAGKAAFTTSQEESQGIPALNTTANEYAAKARMLQNQSQTLQLQHDYTIPAQLQQESVGRARTTAGLTPLTASAQRKNLLEQGAVAFEQITNDSAIAATQGQIENSKYLVKLAVDKKYGPIEETLQIAKDNIALLLNDPETSRQNMIRAQNINDIKSAQQLAITQQKQDETNKFNLANDLLAKGADATTVARIQNASSYAEAQQIAAQSGLFQQGGSSGQNSSSPSSTTGYKAGQLTTLLKSYGFPTTEAALAALYVQSGGTGKYVNDSAHNSKIYSYMTGSSSGVSRPDPKSNYTATSIPSNIQSELISDISNTNSSLSDLYAAYPDVSASYVSSLYNSLKKSGGSGGLNFDDF